MGLEHPGQLVGDGPDEVGLFGNGGGKGHGNFLGENGEPRPVRGQETREKNNECSPGGQGAGVGRRMWNRRICFYYSIDGINTFSNNYIMGTVWI